MVLGAAGLLDALPLFSAAFFVLTTGLPDPGLVPTLVSTTRGVAAGTVTLSGGSWCAVATPFDAFKLLALPSLGNAEAFHVFGLVLYPAGRGLLSA